MPTASSGAASATTPSPWSRGGSPVPAGLARGSSASDGSWILTQGRGRAMAKADLARTGSTIRCAIYTRKSSDEGLEQEFNSLDAQREACEAYVTSQRHAGWLALPDMYDDGGLSGGTIERPALQRLLSDIKAGKVQIIVVYKVDRLTRRSPISRRSPMCWMPMTPRSRSWLSAKRGSRFMNTS